MLEVDLQAAIPRRPAKVDEPDLAKRWIWAVGLDGAAGGLWRSGVEEVIRRVLMGSFDTDERDVNNVVRPELLGDSQIVSLQIQIRMLVVGRSRGNVWGGSVRPELDSRE